MPSTDAHTVVEAEFAWPGGDRPGALTFEHEPPTVVSRAIVEALADALTPIRISGASLRALGQSASPSGCYRLTTPEGSWFIRVSSRWGNPELEQALTDYLVSHGVSVNPLVVAGASLTWNGRRLRVDVRPFIDGRHANGSVGDLRRVAGELAACHRALREFPRAQEVRVLAAAWADRLAEARQRIAWALVHGRWEDFAEQAAWARAHREWLAQMIRQFDPQCHELPDAQCVHGEVHPGNVCFLADGSAVLLDFEESVQRVAPVTWDLAFLFQRFCLHDEPSMRVARQRLEVLAQAYGGPLPRLSPMMRQAAWWSIATLVELRLTEGLLAPLDEYNKFVRLEQQARAWKDL